MSLIARMEDEVKAATLARDAPRRDALRLLLSSLRSAEKELQRPLSDEEELQVLQRERKRGSRRPKRFAPVAVRSRRKAKNRSSRS